jgi:hypothetical protein
MLTLPAVQCVWRRGYDAFVRATMQAVGGNWSTTKVSGAVTGSSVSAEPFRADGLFPGCPAELLERSAPASWQCGTTPRKARFDLAFLRTAPPAHDATFGRELAGIAQKSPSPVEISNRQVPRIFLQRCSTTLPPIPPDQGLSARALVDTWAYAPLSCLQPAAAPPLPGNRQDAGPGSTSR